MVYWWIELIFPSLEGKEKNFLIRDDATSEVSIKEVTDGGVVLLLKVKQIRAVGFLKRHVEESCLDKQKVKEAVSKLFEIIKWTGGDQTGEDTYKQLIDDLKKELGLDKVKRGLQ